MNKVMIIFGTRPEAIKLAPLIKELQARRGIKPVVCITAQHREMLDQVLRAFDIRPDYDLNIMQHGQTLTDVTVRALRGLEDVIKKEKPDLVLVHGDTTTTFCSSLAAFYNQVKVGHVEAGLRTHNKFSPWPEEINRSMVGVLADLHFAPTEKSKLNLLNEGKQSDDIFVTGNTAIDALQTTVSKNYRHEHLDWVGSDRLLMLTAHRRENLGEPMGNIFRAIKKILNEFDDIKVIYPIHLNPQIRELANDIFGGLNKIKIIEPLDVVDFHNFLNRAHIILTDSGGIQEEAPSLGKPVLVLRDTTERPEGVDAGTLRLVGTDESAIYQHTRQLLTDDKMYTAMSKASNPYGDGTASKQIVDVISTYMYKIG